MTIDKKHYVFFTFLYRLVVAVSCDVTFINLSVKTSGVFSFLPLSLSPANSIFPCEREEVKDALPSHSHGFTQRFGIISSKSPLRGSSEALLPFHLALIYKAL